ncbi:LysR family transcriptional regulator [Actinomyces sp. B33]|uniref:LysR family transcriptional regulator n=1 Tax=Actinomyces sp. B33 TaxID=2942131 RepID=UPI002341E570|nr:LysR family transcriptional regulator [Actinomyces sp. B33]MDC4233855.1 LysR family transcriptional regulator [Actinomyces sp. B33]
MHIDPKRLPALLAVQREGGIVAAADILMVSPSAVSQQIQKLEDEVGLELIERTPAGAVLTPAGRIIAASAERIQIELEETLQSLRPIAGQVTGIVTIGAFQTVIRSVLLPFLDFLRTSLPGVELHIAETEEAPGMTALRSGRYDLLVVERDSDIGGAAPRGCTDTPFIDEPWVLVSPEAVGAVGSERGLADIDWLRVAPGTVGAHVMERLTSTLPQIRWVPFSYTNYDAARAMIRAGKGSSVLPSMAVEGLSTEGMRITPLPALGVRRILLRRRNAGWNEASAEAQVCQQLFHWVAEHRGRTPAID